MEVLLFRNMTVEVMSLKVYNYRYGVMSPKLFFNSILLVLFGQ